MGPFGSSGRSSGLLWSAAAAFGCSSAADAVTDGAGGAGEPVSWQLGPIAVLEQPGSAWHVIDEAGELVAQHLDLDLRLLVDPTNPDDDGRYAGVYLSEAGQERFTGTYYGSHCSTFVPDRPHVDQTEVHVTASGATLTVEMVEGSLGEMVDAQFPSDEPFRWVSSWSAGAAGLEVEARGLYYLLLPKASCVVTVRGEGAAELGTVPIDGDTPPLLEYFEDVRTIDLASAVVGPLSVQTDAQVLQVEVTSYPDTSLFELDFDHSFKDRGQLEVTSRLTVPLAP